MSTVNHINKLNHVAHKHEFIELSVSHKMWDLLLIIMIKIDRLENQITTHSMFWVFSLLAASRYELEFLWTTRCPHPDEQARSIIILEVFCFPQASKKDNCFLLFQIFPQFYGKIYTFTCYQKHKKKQYQYFFKACVTQKEDISKHSFDFHLWGMFSYRFSN